MNQSIPPWQVRSSYVCLEASDEVSKRDNPLADKQCFNAYANHKFGSYLQVFTDASKSPDSMHCSAAFTIPELRVFKEF